MQHKVLDKENVVCVKIIDAMFALFKKNKTKKKQPVLMWWLFFWHLTCLTPALQAGTATSRDKGFAVGVHLLFELAICRDRRGRRWWKRRFSGFQLYKQWQPKGKARPTRPFRYWLWHVGQHSPFCRAGWLHLGVGHVASTRSQDTWPAWRRELKS